VVAVLVLVLLGLAVAWVGQRAAARMSTRPTVAWAVSRSLTAVTVRLTPGQGPLGRQILARSHFTVSESSGGQLHKQARGGGAVRIPLPPGHTAELLVQVQGPQAWRQTLTVAVPPEVPLYSFASPAGRAIYITVDDGWTPSNEVLAIMRQTHLPVTAFLIQQAAQRNLPYWRAFVQAGGTIGDHTVSHPNLTKLTVGQASTQWGEARRMLGQWLGRDPDMGRPPYGAFDPAVQAAAYRGGLTVLVGWSVVVDSDGIQTWDGRALEPGEIVLLHWVPGLGHQMVELLAAIRADGLHPMPLTPADFVGQTPQRRSLSGD
jgi:peptidoglycan/xylan/chitin deacetylase (PgdA/CDA1 family)